jgi:predicted glycoside hydrolase/deacetylase ChbG (UPF0249 family)
MDFNSARVLVINADDLGFSADINSTIEEGHRAGCISNATLMVDGNDVEGGIAVARRNPTLGVGLHLDLCPVLGFYQRPYPEIRSSLRETGTRSKVVAEVQRQIERFQSFGLEFSHLDSHRHFHALPEIFSLVVDTAVELGLRSMRLTKDWILPKTPSVYWTDEFLNGAMELLRKHKIIFPGKFVYGAGEYSTDTFAEGLNELMVHVAYHDEYFYREYQRVSSKDFWRDVRNSGIQVTSYRDLAQPNGGPRRHED